MKLSVVILNYNVKHFLQLCLQSVEKAVSNLDAEIIVVDNASTDDSCEMVKRYFPNVKLIENSENLGFSKGNNIGVAQAKGEYICVLNPDTVVAEDTFTSLLNIAEQQDNLGILGCRLIDGRGRFLPESKRNVPTVKVSLNKMLGNGKQYYANHILEHEIGKADVFVGAFMLLKRKVYEQVGGFDEDYFMYGEDIDLSYKILKAGYTNLYVGSSSVIHFKGESTLKDKTYAKRFYGAMQIFYKKHFQKNVLFDGLVWLGIQFASVFSTTEKSSNYKPEHFILISNSKIEVLEKQLQKPIQVRLKVEELKPHSEIILDANCLTFKEIIKVISNSEINTKATFKILPKNTTFILGSNSSKNKGDVVIW